MDDTSAVEERVSPAGKPTASSLPLLPVVAGTGKWHVLTIFAGVALVVTFFLPMGSLARAANPSEVPVKIILDILRIEPTPLSGLRQPEAVIMMAYVFAVAVMPHLFGLLMSLYSLASLIRWNRLRKVPQGIGVVVGILLGLTWVTGVALGLPQLLRQSPGMSGQYLFIFGVMSFAVIIAVVGVAHALLALRRSGWAYLYHGAIGAGLLVFVAAVINGLALSFSGREYLGLTGLTITSLASSLLLFSRVGEARAITGLTWRRTMWYLLTLRLHKAPRPVGLCPGCGYNLFGLREQRCPECGRPFTFEEVEATPETLGFVGVSSAGTG
jgi:hypothetical protein